jgi:hypothetical protein
MFSYHSLISNSTKFVKRKTIFPQDITHISFMQFIKMNKYQDRAILPSKIDSEIYLNPKLESKIKSKTESNPDTDPLMNDSLYRFTNRRHDFILLNKGKLQIDLIDKNFDMRLDIILDENSLICNNKKIADKPSLFNIGTSIFYNIKALTDSEFLFYSSDACNVGHNVELDYYKFDESFDKYTKYSKEMYPYFDFNVDEKDFIV